MAAKLARNVDIKPNVMLTMLLGQMSVDDCAHRRRAAFFPLVFRDGRSLQRTHKSEPRRVTTV